MGIRAFFQKLFGGGETSANPSGNGKRHASSGRGDTLKCVECRRDFLFEEGEQQFYKTRGLSEPKRCPNCRRKRSRRRR